MRRLKRRSLQGPGGIGDIHENQGVGEDAIASKLAPTGFLERLRSLWASLLAMTAPRFLEMKEQSVAVGAVIHGEIEADDPFYPGFQPSIG